MNIDKVRVPKNKDRRRKLTDDDRLKIKQLYKNKWSIHKIAREYTNVCSRRLIQFILFPARERHNAELHKERRKDGRYYNREKHTLAMASTRQHKRDLNN